MESDIVLMLSKEALSASLGILFSFTSINPSLESTDISFDEDFLLAATAIIYFNTETKYNFSFRYVIQQQLDI